MKNHYKIPVKTISKTFQPHIKDAPEKTKQYPFHNDNYKPIFVPLELARKRKKEERRAEREIPTQRMKGRRRY